MRMRRMIIALMNNNNNNDKEREKRPARSRSPLLSSGKKPPTLLADVPPLADAASPFLEATKSAKTRAARPSLAEISAEIDAKMQLRAAVQETKQLKQLQCM